MARPSKGPRQRTTLRFAPDFLRRVDQAAGEAKLDRQGWIDRVLAEALGGFSETPASGFQKPRGF